MINRKPSYNQLTQSSLAAIPDATAGYGLSTPMRRAGFTTGGAGSDADIEVGDHVNTPGGLFGIVKFVGPVRGKAGVFVGVELDREVAAKGKNDGSVDGVQYFQTSLPQSGIFVPLSKASKRDSSSSLPPLTPTLQPPQSLATPRRSDSPSLGRPTGANALRTPGRPSLPRPASPTRRNPPTPAGRGLLPPTTPRGGLSGPNAGRLLLSPTPGQPRLGLPNKNRQGSVSSSTASGNDNARPGTASGLRPPPTPKSTGMKRGVFGMRSKSSMEHRSDDSGLDNSIDAIGLAQGSPTRRNFNTSAEADALRQKLAERDAQLKQQADSLAEMESSLNELQSLMSNTDMSRNPHEEADAMQLRALLREKNDKIHELTTEFDAHRADFRQTIDALEQASSETERVYERRIEEMSAEIHELQERDEEMESVAIQLKQLTEVVTDLEEGLEDARRGEAEARSEVEFLRGEVERVREELRREKEKSALISKGNNIADELSKKNDEIRGLKAIIQSLSGGASPESVSNRNSDLINGKRNGLSSKTILESEEYMQEKEKRERLEREISELKSTIDQKASREDELQREIEEMRIRKRGHSITSTTGTERTMLGSRTSRNMDGGDLEKRDSTRSSKGPVGAWRSSARAGHTANSSISSLSGKQHINEPISERVAEESANHTPINSDGESDAEGLWCEICETGGHDILTCTKMFGTSNTAAPTNPPAPASPPIRQAEAAPSIEEHEQQQPAEVKPLSPVSEKKKSVHLPAAPPMVDTGSGPVAGKSSGIVDEDKWCALCERDGHDTADCPFEDPF